MIRRVAMALLLAAPAAAQGPLTLTEAVDRGLAAHPAVRAAGAFVEAAQAGLGQARAGWWPNLGLDAGATRFGAPMVVAPLHGFDPANPPLFDRTLWQTSLSLSWDLFDPQRGGRIGRARAQSDAAGAGAESTSQAVVADVAQVYFETVTARDLVAAHDARLAALGRERDRAVLFVREGRAARVAQLRAEAVLASAQAERLTVVGRRDAAERSLERLLGLASGSLTGRAMALGWFAAGDTIPGRVEVLDAVRGASPDLAQLQGQVAAAQAARAQARGAWLPQFRVLGRLVQYGSGGGAEDTEWQAGVALSYPLFTGGARGSATSAATAQVMGADARLEDARRQLGDAADRTLAGLASATGQVAALDVAVAQATEVARIEQLALTEGAGVQTDYLSAEAELLRVRAARSEARAAALGARIALAQLMGVLTPAWLAEHLESGS